MRAGFIGAGQMATALASGMSKCGDIGRILAHDPNPAALASMEHSLNGAVSQFTACPDNQTVVNGSTHVFIAVKPQYATAALEGLSLNQVSNPVFISIVAGRSIQQLSRQLGTTNIIRVMPNTPCLIGRGAIAMAVAEDVAADETEVVRKLLSTVGAVVEVPEDLLNAVTGLSGSGPAFVYTFVESMIDGGVLAGLPRDVARQLVIQTVLGSAAMLESSGEHPGVLRDRVTSPGGTTIFGMAELEAGRFRSSVMAAVFAAAERAATVAPDCSSKESRQS